MPFPALPHFQRLFSSSSPLPLFPLTTCRGDFQLHGSSNTIAGMAESLRYGEPDWNGRPVQLVNGEITQRPMSDKSYEELRFDQLAARNSSMRDHPRINSLGRHQDILGLKNQDVLTVIVGDGGDLATWQIHEILLVTSSKFAEAAMKHPVIEKHTRTIRLTMENPDIFERYVKWLYSGFIDTSDHDLLIHMYKLGERMLDDKFQDVCYSILRASLRPYTVNQILYILNNVLEHDRLHKLCLTEVGRGIASGKYNFDRSQLDALFDFMPDLMRAVMDDVAQRSSFGLNRANHPQPTPASAPFTATSPQQTPPSGATHYTPNIGWHFGSPAMHLASPSTVPLFGSGPSAAPLSTSGPSWSSPFNAGFGAAASSVSQPPPNGTFGSTLSYGRDNAASSSRNHIGTTNPAQQGSGTQPPSNSASANSSIEYLFGPKFPHLQPSVGPVSSSNQSSGHVNAPAGGPSSTSFPTPPATQQTRNLFGSGHAYISGTWPNSAQSSSGTGGIGQQSNGGPSDSSKNYASPGTSSTKTPLDVWLGRSTSMKPLNFPAGTHSVSTSARASSSPFDHIGPTHNATVADMVSSHPSTSDKGKAREVEPDAEGPASDSSAGSVQFTPSSSSGLSYDGSPPGIDPLNAPSRSRATDSKDSAKSVNNEAYGLPELESARPFASLSQRQGPQTELKFIQDQLQVLEERNKKRLRDSPPLPCPVEDASTDGSDEDDSVDENNVNSEGPSREEYQLQLMLLEQQNKKRLMMRAQEEAERKISNENTEHITANKEGHTASSLDSTEGIAGSSAQHRTEPGSSSTPYDWRTNSVFMGVKMNQPGAGFGKYASTDAPGFAKAMDNAGRDGVSPFGDGTSFGSRRLLSATRMGSSSGMQVPEPPKFGMPTPLSPPPGIASAQSPFRNFGKGSPTSGPQPPQQQ